MKRIIVGCSLLALASCVAFAQTKSTPLSFEVASIKPAEPSTDGRVIRRLLGGPGSTDPGTITYSNVTVKLLLTQAYNLKDFQVEGPDWIDNLGFDLIAKMAPGTTKDQMAVMLQTLLAERFKVVFHRETKDLPVYALVLGKTGSKMKTVEMPAVPNGSPADAPKLGGVPRPGPDGSAPRMTSGPGIRVMMTPNGRQMAGYMTMAQMANQLSRMMDRPVLDQTELSGTFDVDITWMPDELSQGPRGPGGPPLPGTDTGGRGNSETFHASNEPTLSLPQALQQTLGLKLETRKSAAEILIVDHAEKAVEN